MGIEILTIQRFQRNEGVISTEVTLQRLSRSYNYFFFVCKLVPTLHGSLCTNNSRQKPSSHNVGCCLNQGDPQFILRWGNTQKAKRVGKVVCVSFFKANSKIFLLQLQLQRCWLLAAAPILDSTGLRRLPKGVKDLGAGWKVI